MIAYDRELAWGGEGSPSQGQAALPQGAEVAPPSNVEAEAALLGALMTHDMGWLIEYAADRLSAASFFEPLHGRIFDAIQRQHSLRQPASPVFLKGYFEDDEAIRQVGGVGYLARLTSDLQGLLAPKEITGQIAELAARRDLMAVLVKVHDGCRDLTADVAELRSELDAALDDRQGDAIVVSDAGECMDAALAAQEADHGGVLCRRIEAVDDLLGALEPKSLTIMAGRPGMGKTAVAVSYALGAARAGHGVCFVSLEMSREQLSGRMWADVGFDDAERRVPYTPIQKRTLNQEQRQRVREIARSIAPLPLSVIDAGTLTIGRLDRIVRSQKRQMAARGATLELVVVDYLQLLHPDQRRRSPYEAVSEVSTKLKAIAKDHGVAVLALAQLSRSVEQRPDKRPILADLRDSGQIEQDADAVLFLLREEYYLQQVEPHNAPEEHAACPLNLNATSPGTCQMRP